jgi:hypothetical protein
MDGINGYLPLCLLVNFIVLRGIYSLLVLLVLVLSLLMELLPLWFTQLMESMESDSELEELQDEPPWNHCFVPVLTGGI